MWLVLDPVQMDLVTAKWPRMESLTSQYDYVSASLIPLAINCPQLHCLSLPATVQKADILEVAQHSPFRYLSRFAYGQLDVDFSKESWINEGFCDYWQLLLRMLCRD